MSSNAKTTKRKRSKHTATQQFELYLEAIEGDYVFRSNTINPSLPPNYLNHKWEELTAKLNGIWDGPSLTVDEWKKRFTDWKYATKAKYRNILSHRNQTGGGPHIEIYLTPLEDRALNIWGRITVEGVKTVTEYEGVSIPVPASPQSTSINKTITIPSSPSHEHFQALNISSDILNYDDMTENTNIEFVIIDEKSNKENVLAQSPTVKSENVPSTSKPEKRKRIGVKPLSGLAENLINVTGQNTENQKKFLKLFQNISENYKSLEKEKLNLERERLNFEIKNFNFSNPDFST